MISPVITIDGPAASGKGTLAHCLGDRLGFAVLDTGLLYRFVGLWLFRNGITPGDPEKAGTEALVLAQEITLEKLKDPDLRGTEAARHASVYGTLRGVRDSLTGFQRTFAQTPPPLPDGRAAGGAILDGRDIGTNICPMAPVKFYVTADVTVRAKRRVADLTARGFVADYETVLSDLRERDTRDMTRAICPTKPAFDAVVLDTTQMGVSEMVERALACVSEKLGLRG